MSEFIVQEQQPKLRLDKFLTDKLPLSRSQIQKQIQAGLVLINNKPAKVHQFLDLHDVITIQTPPAEPTSKELAKTARAKLKLKDKVKSLFQKDPLIPTIIYKCADYLILNKPAGLLVHPTARNEADTLVHWLVKKFPEIAKIGDTVAMQKGEKVFRPGIVHRLDRDVSGVMLIPRTQTAFDYFKKQFQLKTVHKEYLALIYGQLNQDQGSIDFEISRKASGEKMAAHPHGSGKGRPAETIYEVLKKLPKYTLLQAQPLTGRTNQLRVHFFALGHPLVGDQVYKLKSFKPTKLKRIFLHAQKMSFLDLNNKQQTFEAPLPEELNNFLHYAR